MCDHRNCVVETSGSVKFSGGEFIDTLRERLICQDCYQDVTDLVNTVPAEMIFGEEDF